MDRSSLRFLTAAALRQRKKEEEEKKKKAMRKTVHQETQRRAAEAIEQARLLLERNKRKRKKKRKRKLPKGSSPRSLPARAVRTQKYGRYFYCPDPSWCLVLPGFRQVVQFMSQSLDACFVHYVLESLVLSRHRPVSELPEECWECGFSCR